METHVFLETRGSHWGLDDVTENSCRPFEMTIMGIVILLNEFDFIFRPLSHSIFISLTLQLLIYKRLQVPPHFK